MMNFQNQRILFQLLLTFTIFDGVALKATFQMNLLKYEAQPNKCCDGFKWVKFGPAKCSECDPYFRICLHHIPGGPSKCVTTSRENNVHTTDLTHGNIQPNHLALGVDSLQGSLSVDVDIKDYDSTTKDDDIDHLFYTFKSVPLPERVNVVLNGTKVRLTISLLVTCQSDYYGPDCSTHCVNRTKSFCSSTGTRLCKAGYSGTDCNIAVGSSSQKPIVTSTKTNDRSAGEAEYTTDHQTESTPTDRTYTLQTVPYNATETSSVKTSILSSMTHVKDEISEYTTQNMENSLSPVSHKTNDTIDFKMTTVTSGTEHFRTNTSLDEMNSSTTVTPTAYQRKAPGNKYRVPEPLEIYSCNVMIEGHKVGLHQPVEEIITAVLTHAENSTEVETLTVHVTSSTFETTDNGVAVTDVSFIVQHNGEVLSAMEVSRKLYSPMTSKLLTKHLNAQNLKEYSSSSPTSRSPKSNVKQWVSDHIPFVSVISCMVLFVIVVLAVVFGRRCKRTNTSLGVKKNAFSKSVKYNDDHNLDMFSNKMSFDTPFALENPLYDFSCDQLQPSNASRV